MSELTSNFYSNSNVGFLRFTNECPWYINNFYSDSNYNLSFDNSFDLLPSRSSEEDIDWLNVSYIDNNKSNSLLQCKEKKKTKSVQMEFFIDSVKVLKTIKIANFFDNYDIRNLVSTQGQKQFHTIKVLLCQHSDLQTKYGLVQIHYILTPFTDYKNVARLAKRCCSINSNVDQSNTLNKLIVNFNNKFYFTYLGIQTTLKFIKRNKTKKNCFITPFTDDYVDFLTKRLLPVLQTQPI